MPITLVFLWCSLVLILIESVSLHWRMCLCTSCFGFCYYQISMEIPNYLCLCVMLKQYLCCLPLQSLLYPGYVHTAYLVCCVRTCAWEEMTAIYQYKVLLANNLSMCPSDDIKEIEKFQVVCIVLLHNLRSICFKASSQYWRINTRPCIVCDQLKYHLLSYMCKFVWKGCKDTQRYR